MSHSLQNKQDKLTAGTGISITDNTIACTVKAPSLIVEPYAIGSYAFAVERSGKNYKGPTNQGYTSSGSNLSTRMEYTSYGSTSVTTDSDNLSIYHNGTALTGTWKLMGQCNGYSYKTVYTMYVGLWQRIS